MSKPESVHFTVEGEFITNTARSLWADEDEPERAMRILRCMQGITEGQILDVLEGRSKLTGNSTDGINLEPDSHAGKTTEALFAKMRAERDAVKEDLADLTQLSIGDTVIVGSHTGAREVPRRRTSKVLRAGGRKILNDDIEFDDTPPDISELRKKPATKTLRIYKRRDDFGKNWGSPAQSKKVDDLKKEEEDEACRERAWKAARETAKKALAPTPTITSETGWLSPAGLFYPALYGEHGRVAWALGFAEHPQDHGCKPPGWVRLGVNMQKQYFFEDTDVPPTEPQRLAVREFCERSGIELPWWLRESESE